MSQTEISPPPALRKRTINVRVTIDTDSLPQTQEQAGDAASPTSIDQDQGYMVVTGSREAWNESAGDIVFEADAGDMLRFFISSGSNNFEQLVLIDSIRHTGGDEILADCASQSVQWAGIAPESPTNVLPAQIIERRFHFFQCSIAGNGTGSYDLVFAVYGRSEDAQPRWVSHYRWAMRLTAQSNRRKS